MFEQAFKNIDDQLDCLVRESLELEGLYRRKLTAWDELKASILREAFNGKL